MKKISLSGMLATLLLLLFWGCGSTGEVRVQELPVPSREGGEPRLFVHGETALLSWVEYLDDSTDALLFARLEGDAWSAPREIARGTNWFVNWADFPSVIAHPDNPRLLAAHWLQKSAPGTYDYRVMLSFSRDGGQSWSAPMSPHQDSIPAEHGFVTLLPQPDERLLAVWLDGRQTKSGGAMTLRSALLDFEGHIYQADLLDERVCDCCSTDAVQTPFGPLVAYRDRSESEIRDIALVRQTPKGWSPPHT
ncbi:MAG: exo-alpha-sialidase, partial [Bacteroidetes bacterium]